MENGNPLYLSSLESRRLKPVRECRLVRFLILDTGKMAAVASLDPGFNGQDLGIPEIETVILSCSGFPDS